jgi:predicted nucleotidyltransferase
LQRSVPDNPHSLRKVGQVRDFIAARLVGEPSFRGAVVTDSVAHGDARADSDVDMFLIFRPLDLAVVPGDFVWSPRLDSYFGRSEQLPEDPDLLHIDARRVDLDRLAADQASELERHLLAGGLLVWDRDEECAGILERVSEYPGRLRRQRLIDLYYQVDYHLRPAKALAWYERGDGRLAHAHFDAGIDYFLKFMFAWHGSWLTWPNKRVQFLRGCPDPVGGFEDCLEQIMLVRDFGRAELNRRIGALGGYMAKMCSLLQSRQILPLESPLDYAYGQSHPEIGLRHSMGDWRRANAQRLRKNRAEPTPDQ